jgi:hypothetical protein
MDNFDAKNPAHVTEALTRLFAQVGQLTDEKTKLQEQNVLLIDQLKVMADQRPIQPIPAKGTPKLPLPEKYDGKRQHFRQFINSVKLQFSVCPDSFPNDASKTGFVASLLRGAALDWITPYLELQDPMLSSWVEFEAKFKAMFDDPHRARTAVGKLTQLRQGRRPVVAYAAEFRRIVMDADFDNNAQVYWFRAGLTDDILDELTHTVTETDLEKFIAQCVLIDTRLSEREAERKRRSAFGGQPRSTSSSVQNDPMVLDSTTTSTHRGPISAEERKRRLENNLCLYCEGAGHQKANCPKKSGNGQSRQHR